MFARVVWAAVLLTVAATPVVYSTATRDVYRLPKTLFFQAAALVIGAAIVAWDARSTELGARAARHRIPLILAASALAWTGVVSMTAQNPVVASGAPLAMFCLAVFFGAALIFARRTPGLVLTAMLAPAIANAVVVVLQWRRIWTPVPRTIVANPPRLAYTGFQGNPDMVGVYLLIPAIAAIAAAVAFRRWRLPLIAVSAVLLIAMLLTGSLTVFIALAAVFLAFTVVAPTRKARIAMIAMIIAGIIAVGSWKQTRRRAIGISRAIAQGNANEALTFRLPAWSVAWRMFLEHPLTGVGPGGYAARYMSYKLAGDELHPQWMQLGNFNFGEAHNDHLQLLAEAGLPGLALFVTVLARVALLSLRGRGSGEEGAFVRLFALPAATGLGIASLAQFPLYLTASSSAAVFAAALCFAWGDDEAG
jgi:hypothetical protein